MKVCAKNIQDVCYSLQELATGHNGLTFTASQALLCAKELLTKLWDERKSVKDYVWLVTADTLDHNRETGDEGVVVTCFGVATNLAELKRLRRLVIKAGYEPKQTKLLVGKFIKKDIDGYVE